MRKVLLFRLNLPTYGKQKNIEISLKNTVRIMKASGKENAYLVLMEDCNGYRFEEISNDKTASFIVEKVSDGKSADFHVWSQRDPENDEPSASYYYPDKDKLFPAISECWKSSGEVYAVICDTQNIPHYIGRLNAYSKSAKGFLERIFIPPDSGKLTSAFFFRKSTFFDLRKVRDYCSKHNCGKFGKTLNEIEKLCKDELNFPLKFIGFEFSKAGNLSELLQFLGTFSRIEKQEEQISSKESIIKNFLKGKVIEMITYLVFEELLEYKVQISGYENWATVLKEDIVKGKQGGNLSNRIRKIPDFYFSYRNSYLPPIMYKDNPCITGWIESKYRNKINDRDILKWKQIYENEVYLLIYQSADRKFYFVKVADLPDNTSLMESFLFERFLTPPYNEKVIKVMEQMIELIQRI